MLLRLLLARSGLVPQLAADADDAARTVVWGGGLRS